jgi:hypothetical protein
VTAEVISYRLESVEGATAASAEPLATRPTFNMTFSLTGETVPEAGPPVKANCHVGQAGEALGKRSSFQSNLSISHGFHQKTDPT